MAANKMYDLAVKVGTYTKDGETKNRYQNVGVVIDGPHGPYMLLNRYFNPAGVPGENDRDSILVSMFKPGFSGRSNTEADVPF